MFLQSQIIQYLKVIDLVKTYQINFKKNKTKYKCLISKQDTKNIKLTKFKFKV